MGPLCSPTTQDTPIRYVQWQCNPLYDGGVPKLRKEGAAETGTFGTAFAFSQAQHGMLPPRGVTIQLVNIEKERDPKSPVIIV